MRFAAAGLQVSGWCCAAVGVWLLFGVGWLLLFAGAGVFGVGVAIEYGKPRGDT